MIAAKSASETAVACITSKGGGADWNVPPIRAQPIRAR